MNKVLAILLLPALLFAQAVWDGTANTAWYNATDTEFTITTAEQLAGLRQLVNNGTDNFNGKTIRLGADIMLNDTINWLNWATSAPARTWTAIGTGNSPFRGTFDGDGHVVSGVYINNNSNFHQGLFGYVSSGTIRNIGVVASYIRGGSYVGGLVGRADNTTITNSYATGNVEGDSNVGGLVGWAGGTIINSYATGNVVGYERVGGLVGSGSGTITHSYATGNVEGSNHVGGFAGSSSGTVTNSYATGNVAGSGNRIGGFAGSSSGTVTNSYATGNVAGSGNGIGGLVGNNSSSGSITSSYYNRQTSGQSDIGRGEGKTTAQMQNKNTYIGWNFEGIWHIDPLFNNGFPYLQWQNELRDAEIEPAIEPQLYTGFPINPKTEKVTLNGKELTEGEDFEYRYGQNIHVATGGIIYIVGKKYFGSKAVEFIIKPARIIDISWFPKCGAIFTYNGEPQNPEPFAMGLDGKTYELEVEGAQINTSIGLVAMAKLKTAEEDVILQNSSCLYAIEPQELQVSWAGPREFTYNKMNQHPTPSISELPSDLSESDFIFGGYGSVADEYRGSKAPYYIINPADPVKAGNYTLLNNRADYVIHKRPLRPYFSASLPDFETNAAADTLWVPSEIFSEPSLLEETLSKIISYSGFATNTETNESDNAENSLSGTP
ncbi:MAG: hypothetical protein LBC85_03460, partial [Fibromonadaceae bacterium]|nr:hypothetical protein [Fibromonadaceae bacterium]